MQAIPRRALIVDDEKSVRSLLIARLSAEGFACDESEDGTAAIHRVLETEYDLIVTDLRMPNQHGHALCQAVLAQTKRPLLVVVTGIFDTRLIKDLRARGVDEVFHKPVNPVEFSRRIRELFEAFERKGENTDKSSTSDDRTCEAPAPGIASGPSKEQEIGTAPGEEEGGVTGSDEVGQTHAVAILLKDVRRANELAANLRDQPFARIVIESTDALCQLVENRRIDIVVLENARFGFIDPCSLLRHLTLSSSRTEIVIVGEEGADRLEASAAKTLKILPRSVSDADMLRAIRGALASKIRARGRIPSEARKLARRFGKLNGSQHALLKLGMYLRWPAKDVDPERLVADIAANSEVAAETLRLANGASAGLRSPITSVSEAIKWMGETHTAALLVCSGLKSAEKNILHRVSPALRGWYQRRSTLNASIVSVVAQHYFKLPADLAFVLGLVQDVGIAVLAAAFTDRYARLVDRARTCGPVRLHVIEHEYFNVDHAEMSAALVERWHFPEELFCPIRFHHETRAAATRNRECFAFIGPMRIAEAVADACDNPHPSRKQELTRLLGEYRSETSEISIERLESAVQIAVQTSEQFRMPHPDESNLKAIFRELFASAGVAVNS